MSTPEYMNDKTSSEKVIYQEISTLVNRETGEIIEKKNNKVIKKSKTPDFVMLFTRTSPALIDAKLTSGETSLLFSILTGNYISRDNFLDIGSATRDELAERASLKRRTVNTLILKLVAKEIILRKEVGSKSYRYLLNPFIFGKGSWQNIEKLRYDVKLEYDFNKRSLTESNSTSVLMEDANEILTIPHEVVAKSQTVIDGDEVNTIKIAEKVNNIEKEEKPFEKKEDSGEIELELLKAENDAKRLKIQEMELTLKLHEKGLL